ncbi:YdcF family protein [Catalinimonas niigatensis]|uniref:YdcF family protein n=1 Tax=Catalinimonas niigatensis TaxID=1397264 RepID=UPI002666D6C8|nr:YdcF family protein [Catalinimonas niigatensis]WPP50399.1 YdcF family protein [Catalinimonas niigatensis]
MDKKTWIQTIWNYHLMQHTLERADCILTLGSHDLRVASHAADLYLQGWADYLIFSGGLGRLTEGMWEKPEAEVFAEVAIQKGVPEEHILMENRSTNTGENLRFTEQLMKEKGLDFQKFIVVQKPYMERRAYATFKKHFPAKECLISSPPLSYDEYCIPTDPEINHERVVHLIVGDLQRIKVYADKGFQVPQEIPEEVWQAYEGLVNLGYKEHFIAE